MTGQVETGVVMDEFLRSQYFGLGAGVWIGIGVGAGVLLVLLAVVLTRLGKSKSPPTLHADVGAGAAASEPSARSKRVAVPTSVNETRSNSVIFSVDFEEDTLEGWQDLKGGTPTGQIVDGWYRLEAGRGSRTINVPPASPERKYHVEWRVKLTSASTSGHRNNYSIGLLFMSEDNAILQWWQLQAPLETEGDVFVGSMDTVAPAGTVKMALGMQGNAQPTSDGIIALGRVEVTTAI